MSTSEKADQISEVFPRKPWVNKSQSLREIAKPVVAALLGATMLVLLTGLAGPLGFYLAFVLSFVVASFVQGMRHDQVKAVDKMMTALVVAGFAMAFIPWASILFTVFQRGASAIPFVEISELNTKALKLVNLESAT